MLRCEICDRTLKNKYTLLNHLKRIHNDDKQKQQELIEKARNLSKNKLIIKNCKYCDVGFTTVGSYNKHVQFCNSESILNSLKQKMRRLDKEDLEILDIFLRNLQNEITINSSVKADKIYNFNPNHSSNCNFNNNDVNYDIDVNYDVNYDVQNNFNITILNQGHENTEPVENPEFISDLLLNDIDLSDMINLSNIIVEMFKKIQFNKDYPENHNMYVSNNKPYKPYHIYKDDQWNPEHMKNFDKCIDMANHYVSQLLKTIEYSYNKNYFNYLIRIKLLDQIKKCLKTNGDKLLKRTARELFKISFEHRDIVKPTFEQTQT